MHPTDTNLKQNIENKFQKSTSEFVGQTITNISISNGTEANPGNTNAVHTGWISCKYGDVVSVEVLRKPKNAGDYFVFGYSTYPATTSSTAYRIRYADFDIDTTGNNKVQIKLPAETNISFAIAESTGSGATALRETDFSSGDVIVKIEHSVVEDDVNFYESYAEKSIAQPAKLASTDVRLRVLSYNVSGYKCDTSVDSISTAKQQGLRNFLGDIKADFAGLQENTKYTTGSSGSKTVQNYIWYSSFADWFHADKYSQVIFSRYARTSGGANSVKVAFSNATGENRALMAVSFPFGNKTLLVCSFHAIWADMGGSALDSANVTARQTQFTELFNWVNGSITLKSLADLTTDVSCPTHTHAVILGDFNTITDTDKTNLQTIASSASFTLGNGGRFGWMYTDRSANGNFSLDNIAVSSNVALDSFEPKWDWYGKLYSDHVPIVSDIILQGTP